MRSNISKLDRTVRIIIAAIVAVLWFTGTVQGTLGVVLLAVGVVLLLTSIINFCPLYWSIGISTKKK